jgi:putative PIG3 family NAD(P)H quinone oxidoreductase
MTAVLIREPGGPEVLEPDQVARPAPGEGQVLIRVEAAGVNRPDVLQRQGLYPAPPGASNIPGLEVAGEVVAAGAGASRFRPGNRVCALTSGGGYAEYAVADEGSCLPVPAGLDIATAACIPETFFTVWHNVFQRGGLKSGEAFLVHGGSSGIGATAIQLARAFGARVFATAGSAEKCAFCMELGAEVAINYRERDFVEEVKAATGGRGADLILDMVGGSYIQRNITCAAEDGRIVQIAFLEGPKASLNLMPVMLKRLTLTGSTLRPRSVGFKAALAREVEEKALPLIASGAIRIVIDSEFPLHEAAEAHRRMETSAHMGKIVLRVN